MGNFTHLNQSNSDYIENLYQEYLKKSDSVPLEWKLFFEGVEFGEGRETSGLSETDLKVFRLVQAFRDYGHFEAQLDPLTNYNSKSEELSLQRYGLTEADLAKPFKINSFSGTLAEIIERVRRIYCGTISVQVAETKPKIREWFLREMEEGFDKHTLTKEQKVEALKHLIETEVFEKFLHTRFVGAKRFSGEGTDALIPMLFFGTDVAASLGVKEFVIGMAHRGRLNVLTNYLGKGYAEIFGEFEGKMKDDVPGLDGDVKYHLGYSSDKKTQYGNFHASLAFNPSHLEAVDPVVLGMTRAKQRLYKDTKERKKVIPVLIHGDAAFAGQGVVMETLQQSQLEGYRVGGTLHIILDNQVGFTADPEDTRSSPYSSDVSKGQLTPVIHVNADDAEACIRAMSMAIRFRQEFAQDVVINMIGYRRYGHNEGDEPAFTQPVMYDLIKKHPTLTEIYGQRLISEKLIDKKYVDTLFSEKMDNLQKILEETKKNPPKRVLFSFEGKWKGLRRGEAKDFEKPTNTRAKIETLIDAGTILTTVPKNFNLNPKLKKLLEQREEMIKGKRPIDWGMAELLAYGTLMFEGTSVRLSGQDCGRGTFSHRHSVFYDQKTGEKFVPLKTIKPGQVEYCVYDSLLSEMGVLGFEYGNSISDPSFLTMWEAQFGDFANGAQIIIDQFISSGETKWYRMNGLVMLLPHGYEGQGPEHSSARLERFLQLCGQTNMQVCNLSLPSQIFHVLRRQVKRDFRKPLVIMTPKSLLRHPKVVSSLEDLANGTFQELIIDPNVKDPQKVETAIFCSGKIYYELDDYRDAEKIETENFSINRIEQLYPFPKTQIVQWLKSTAKLKRIVWCQEEPENMGAWPELRVWLQEAVRDAGKNIEIAYIGRDRRASPAVGSLYKHKEEQTRIALDCYKAIKG